MTPYEREQAALRARLGELHSAWKDNAGFLQSASSPGAKLPVVLLAAALTIDELEVLRIAVASRPARRYERSLVLGHHSRAECLERPGEWCRGIGGHPGRCDSCPTRSSHRVTRLLDQAIELRRALDTEMWSSAPREEQ